MYLLKNCTIKTFMQYQLMQLFYDVHTYKQNVNRNIVTKIILKGHSHIKKLNVSALGLPLTEEGLEPKRLISLYDSVMSGNVVVVIYAWLFGVLTAKAFTQSAMHFATNHNRHVDRVEIDSSSSGSEFYLFDFTKSGSVEDWIEQSDTVRDVGKSKAALVIQDTQMFRRAIFFSLLNPQVNGAGFAGMRILVNLDLSRFSKIEMKAKAQGNTGYKFVLRHKGEDNEPFPTYENFFEAPTDFSVITAYLDHFKPYYRGRPLNSSEAVPLDTSQITSFGIQIYGGVYSPKKQSGPSSLEIDWIRAV